MKYPGSAVLGWHLVFAFAQGYDGEPGSQSSYWL
jgi:hypothetical protein